MAPRLTCDPISQYTFYRTYIISMFCKKTTAVELPPIAKPAPKDTAQLKELNHEVRPKLFSFSYW